MQEYADVPSAYATDSWLSNSEDSERAACSSKHGADRLISNEATLPRGHREEDMPKWIKVSG